MTWLIHWYRLAPHLLNPWIRHCVLSVKKELYDGYCYGSEGCDT